jgi:cellulose synthase/poly-beta-1,6-N-acetylglucosamine synthase-like glycosyltransferase
LVFTDGPPQVAGDAVENPSAEGVYWRWETKLKTDESTLDSCLGANGAIYAIRPELFWRGIPANTIIDDFVIGMKVREQGFRVIYEPDAIAYEELPNAADEWRRRVRIGAGDYQSLRSCSALLGPRYGCFAWSFWSHKVLRWFTPHLMLLAVAAAAVRVTVAGSGGFTGLCALATLFGFAALCLAAWSYSLGITLPDKGKAHHFLMMQAALLRGFLRYLRGGLKGSWDRTPRG